MGIPIPKISELRFREAPGDTFLFFLRKSAHNPLQFLEIWFPE
jgi:hypothetical protein